MNQNKFSLIIAVLTAGILIATYQSLNTSILITKLFNIALVLCFGTLFGYFYLNMYFNVDEKISKNSIALAQYLGFIYIAIAIAISNSF